MFFFRVCGVVIVVLCWFVLSVVFFFLFYFSFSNSCIIVHGQMVFVGAFSMFWFRDLLRYVRVFGALAVGG